MNIVQQKDIKEFASTFALADRISNSSFLITGATGLIGSTLIHCLLELDCNIRIVAPIRNKIKAIELFENKVDKIELIECDLTSFNYDTIEDIDYIIHCAAPTSSKFFIEKPVETFNIILDATTALLKYAMRHNIKSFVYLSSIEVYGEIPNGADGVTENMQGFWDPMNVRSSYPMAKRATENLCCSYASEYKVPVKVARLTQTTGAGIAKDDNRVIAQFTRLAANGKNIVLHTIGDSARPYCYITDCISALLYILLKGESGEAYNVANEDTYISARGMAEFLSNHINPNIAVCFELNKNMGYAPISQLKLSTEKIKNLGWKPYISEKEMYKRLYNYLKS